MKYVLAMLMIFSLAGCSSLFRTDNPIGAAVLGLPEPPEAEPESVWYGCAGDAQISMDGRTGELSCSDGKPPIEVPPPKKAEWEANTAQVLATHARH